MYMISFLYIYRHYNSLSETWAFIDIPGFTCYNIIMWLYLDHACMTAPDHSKVPFFLLYSSL